MDLEECHGDFGIDRAKDSFLRDEAWQPARELLERLTTVTDWGERIVAVNLCLEPLLGALLRRGLLLRGCTVYGDHVLPVLLRCAQLETTFDGAGVIRRSEAGVRVGFSAVSGGMFAWRAESGIGAGRYRAAWSTRMRNRPRQRPASCRRKPATGLGRSRVPGRRSP